MIKDMKKRLSLVLAVSGALLIGGSVESVNAQQITRDPFLKAPQKPKPGTNPAPASTGNKVAGPKTASDKPAAPKGPVTLTAPPVDQRVNYYTNVIRPEYLLKGMQPPKPTVVMTLDEIQVNGVFRTPRGYAAMVELKPIKLSYAMYPGDKCFDGQLVAIEENHLVFRKVTKLSNNKFVVAEEKKILRKLSLQEELNRNTADALPAQPAGGNENRAENTADREAAAMAAANGADKKQEGPKTTGLNSPFDEMLKAEKEKPADAAKEGKDKKAGSGNKKDKKAPATKGKAAVVKQAEEGGDQEAEAETKAKKEVKKATKPAAKPAKKAVASKSN